MHRATSSTPRRGDRTRSRRARHREPALALAALALALAGAPAARAASWLVRPDGTGDVPTIAAAIALAQDGDEILLADGVFAGAGNRDLSYDSKAITIRSVAGSPEACVIDCQASALDPHRGFACAGQEGPGSVLRGVTVRNGHHPEAAGGLYCRRGSPTVVDCVFLRCYGGLGGAIGCDEGASPAFTGCRFEADSASIGGAVWAAAGSAPSFTECVFAENGADIEAGAISLQLDASLTAVDCLFADNWGNYRGGGLLADDYVTAQVTGCTFVGNRSQAGGGAYCCASAVGTFTGCTFHANSAPLGAQLTCGCHGIAYLDRCILAFGLQGAAIYCWSTGEAHLTCGDVFGNAGGDWIGYIAPQAGVAGNFAADPLFCDAGARDLTLHAGSPCLPGHHPNGESCGTIGAWPIGCPTGGAPDDPGSAGGWRLRVAGPNPFTRSTRIECRVPPGAPRAWLAVFDLGGRRVRRLEPDGRGVAWDGTDDAGQPVPAGVYFLRLGPGDRRPITTPVGRLR